MHCALIFLFSAMLFSVCKAQENEDVDKNDTTSSEILATSVSTFSEYEEVDNNNDTIKSNESSPTSVSVFSGISGEESTTEPTFNKALNTQSPSNESSAIKVSPGKVLTTESTHGWRLTSDDRSGVRKSSTTDYSTTKDTVSKSQPKPSSDNKASAHVGLIIGITAPIILLVAVISAFFLRCLCKTKNVDIKEHVNAVYGGDENVRLQCIENAQQKAVGTEQDPIIVRLDQTEPVNDSGDYIKLQRIEGECLGAPDAEQTAMNINGDQVKLPYTSHTDIAT